jgi:hypothetical protein
MLVLILFFEDCKPLGAEKTDEETNGGAIEILGRADGRGGTVERQGVQAVGGDEIAPGPYLGL